MSTFLIENIISCESWCLYAVSLPFSLWSNWCLYYTRVTHLQFLLPTTACPPLVLHTRCCVTLCVQLCLGERLQHFSGTLCPVASLLTSPARSCHLPGICLPGRLPQQRCVAICIASLLRVWRGSRNSNLAILMNESFCQCVYSL